MSDVKCSIEVIIIIGGRKTGTRFRPLSFELPKPLFPIAGRPIIQHLIDQCMGLPNMISCINIMGYYDLDSRLASMIDLMKRMYAIPVRYLQESGSLGTGGGMLRFRDRLVASRPDAILFINGDIYADLPLKDMVEFYNQTAKCQCCILVKDTNEEFSNEYGCVVIDETTRMVKHYVEKPDEFRSSTINCGVYLFDPDLIFDTLLRCNPEQTASETNASAKIQLERDVFPLLVNDNRLFAYKTSGFWGSIKSPSSALLANSKYLEMKKNLSKLSGESVTLDQARKTVFIDTDCQIDESSQIGPNVSIGKGVKICKGVRIRDAIILDNCEIGAHSCIFCAILGSRVKTGKWCRIQGVQIKGYRTSNLTGISYDEDNKISDIAVIGHDVKLLDEVMIRSSIVLPHKDISKSCHCEILL